MKHKFYTPDHVPFVSNISSYCSDWMTWWTLCQPAWRQEQGWPLPRDNNDTASWFKVGGRGQNGLFLAVLSTAWWAYSIKTEEEWVKFDEAVDDIDWVIACVVGYLKVFLATKPSERPPAPKKTLKPKPSASYMTRETGKRQPKLTHKLLEMDGF